MRGKLTTLLSFILLAISPAYAALPEQPNSVPVSSYYLQSIIDNANRGDPNAQNKLGNIYCEGDGVSQDYNEAFKWYTKAAEQGYAKSQFNLGLMYCYGEGVQQDSNEAVKWFTRAAEQGKSYAQYSLGLMYYYGDEIPQDYNEAIKWFSKAAELGDANSMFKLGEIYSYGEGVAEDSNIAVEWYLEAAQAGNVEAMYELGDRFNFGRGVTEDANKAAEWYGKAIELYRRDADAGDKDAMYKIGFMYETGRGVDKNYEEARNWYKKAIELGGHEANKRLVVIFAKKYYKIALWGFLTVLVAGGFVYGHEKRTSVEDTMIFQVANELRDWTLWMNVKRYAGALFLYFIYWLILWGSMTKVIGATLSPDKARKLVEIGEIESVWEYGWGDHYIWFLISFCFVTFCSAVLAGATAKKKGVLVASIANLPLIIFMLLTCWVFYTNAIGINVESPIAWKIILPLSIAGSIYFSILGGYAGEEAQESDFKENSILGIRPLHWSWLWLISPLYIQGIVYALVPIIKWSWQGNYMPSIFQILCLFIYGYPMYLMYQILSGEILARKNVLIKIVSFIGVYLGGLTAAFLFDLMRLGLFKLISRIF